MVAETDDQSAADWDDKMVDYSVDGKVAN